MKIKILNSLVCAIISIAFYSCCNSRNIAWIRESTLNAHERIKDSRNVEAIDNPFLNKIDSSGKFINITGIPDQRDSMGMLTELALSALIPGQHQGYYFLKTNKKLAAVYYNGSTIYKYRNFGYSKIFGRERRIIRVRINRYSFVHRLTDFFTKSCRIGSKETPDFVVTAGYLFKWKECGEEARKYRYYISWKDTMPRIISYIELEGHNICCRQSIRLSDLPGNYYLIGCKKVYVHFDKDNRELLIMPFSDESKDIAIGNIKIECIKNGIRYKHCEISRGVDGLKLRVKLADVDSVVIDLSEAIDKDSCNWFEYLIK
jgi:hypothetical protein